jgi:hypothetical protein
MNERELASILPDLVQQYLEGTSNFQVLFDPAEAVGPSGPQGVWSFRMMDSALVVLSIHQNATLAVTAGLALNAPYTSEVSHQLNALNADAVTVGRLFLVELSPGLGAILMQEMAYCNDMQADHPPSLQTLLQLVGRVAGVASRLAPELCERTGGHLPPDDTDLLILSKGVGL